MADVLDPATIRSNIALLLTGGPPPPDLLANAGGWGALEALAPTLAEDALLVPMVAVLARDVKVLADQDKDIAVAEPAALAIVDAVFASTDMLDFTDALEAVCSSPGLVALVGREVADRCVPLAGPPIAEGDEAVPSEAVVVRHAVALETATRLAVQKRTTQYKVLGLFDDVREPQPVRYARAVTRSVACAYDYWAPDDSVADVLDILTGAAKPTTGTKADGDTLAIHEQYRLDVAPDATWARANVMVARALRATNSADMEAKLTEAIRVLDQVALLEDRADAEVLRAALKLLAKLVPSLGTESSGPVDARDWDLVGDEVRALDSRTAELSMDTHGLSHWSGDRKLVVLHGWNRLVRDLEWLRSQLERDSLYEAAVVLDDLVEIYGERRAYDILGSGPEGGQVLEVVRPAMASGLAARAGLVRNLSDHVADLEGRLVAAATGGELDVEVALRERVELATRVLIATRSSLTVVAEPPGKPEQQAADLPPLLAELLPPEIAKAVEGVSAGALAKLAADLADRQAARGLSSDLVVAKVRKDMLEAISMCEDFNGAVAIGVGDVLDQLIQFVARRMNTQASYKPYLYDEGSKEKALQDDLYDWLAGGQLSGFTNMEVQEVAGGRVDIQIQFPGGFQIYLELKADSTRVPVAEKAKYIRQTATYQASSVRIGFLVVLRTKATKDGRLPQHLTDYVTHTTVDVDGSASQRHVVMLEVAGGRKAPSNQD